jgi:hypothetical protein
MLDVLCRREVDCIARLHEIALDWITLRCVALSCAVLCCTVLYYTVFMLYAVRSISEVREISTSCYVMSCHIMVCDVMSLLC